MSERAKSNVSSISNQTDNRDNLLSQDLKFKIKRSDRIWIVNSIVYLGLRKECINSRRLARLSNLKYVPESLYIQKSIHTKRFPPDFGSKFSKPNRKRMHCFGSKFVPIFRFQNSFTWLMSLSEPHQAWKALRIFLEFTISSVGREAFRIALCDEGFD